MTDLAERILDWIQAAPFGAQPPDELALAVLARQIEATPTWRRLQPSLPGRLDPSTVRPWPVDLYKRAPAAAPMGGRIFSTSGTSGHQPGLVAYSVADMALMDAAIDRNAARHLFPDGPARTRILVLAPPPEARPQMIMAYGMARLIERFGLPGSRFYIGPDGLDAAALAADLASAVDEGTPVTLIGATFGFVQLADAWAAAGHRLALPPGSRVMDAGGNKGRARELSRSAFAALVEATFGVTPRWQTNLLGMTELGSQIYDHVVGDPDPRPVKRPPPWMRSWVVDPERLAPVADGAEGLLVHLDLANLDHPALVLTQDLGRRRGDGFEILGRAEGAEARGCSVALDEFAAAGLGA